MKTPYLDNSLRNFIGLLLFLLLAAGLLADDPPAPPVMGRLLNRYRFDDTNWLSGRGNPPLAFTNLTLVPSWNTNAVQIDSAEPAFLQYREIEPTGRTNIACFTGSFSCWVKMN